MSSSNGEREVTGTATPLSNTRSAMPTCALTSIMSEKFTA